MLISSLSRRDFLRASILASAGSVSPSDAKKVRRPAFNVLFIAVDDLRPALGCYGDSTIRTPHIDRVAAEGLTFTRAYCQQAACSPSRTSLLTGRRPDTTRVHDLRTHFRRHLPNVVTLPQHFKRRGYVTAALGKVFHNPRIDDHPSWSIPSWLPDLHPWDSKESRSFARRQWEELERANWVSGEPFSYDPAERRGRTRPQSRSELPSWESPDVPDGTLADGKTAEAVIEALSQLRDQRFFVAAGFLKPHLPFVAPKKYYELYPQDEISESLNIDPPRGAPAYALHDSPELRHYSDIAASGPIPPSKARELIRAYRACVSYVDAQIGRVIEALDGLGLREETVIVFWGDHGYHLGEHGLWNKQTNFEAATRCPLIVSAPGQRSRGKKTAALVELVDIYPSLCEICDLPRPGGLEGSSFGPLFEDPERLWKRAAFSQYPREIPGVGPGMGRSIRTRRYRYTEWRADDSPYSAAELYDYEADPLERVNIANHPENVSLVNGLAGMLREGWPASLPPTDGPA